MSIRIYKAYTPGTRNRALSAFETITKSTPEKKLTVSNHRKNGEIIEALLRFAIVVEDIKNFTV